MNLVIPMAGHGSRFRDAGWKTPKPMIDVLGAPMYTWALNSLPVTNAKRVILIVLADLVELVQRDARERYPGVTIDVVAVDSVTEGQACTVLLARNLIDDDTPLVIFNADTRQRSPGLLGLIRDPAVDGALSVFKAEGTQWSFVRTDGRSRVLETAEKQRISDWASTGLYYFARGRDFVGAADAMIAANERANDEFYVAPVYNRLVKGGANIYLDICEEVEALGTPADLNAFLQMRGHGEAVPA